MDAVMNLLPRNWQRKELKIPRFRKSSESFRSLSPDVKTEARKKAAAWAWHQRAGGDASPKRRVVDSTAAVFRNLKVDRPISRFKVESTLETVRESESSSGTELYDAFDLSSFARQISNITQRSRDESSLKISSEHCDGVYKLSQHALDPFSGSGSSSFRESRQQLSQKGDALRSYSLSTRWGARQKSAKWEATGGNVNLESAAQTDRLSELSCDDFRNAVVSKRPKSRVETSFSRIQKMFRKCHRSSAKSLDFDAHQQVQNQHHYHHHHHFYYHQSPDEDLEILEGGKGRRSSDSVTSYTKPAAGAENDETRRHRRHSEDFTLRYKERMAAVAVEAEVENCCYHMSSDKLQASQENNVEGGHRFRRYSDTLSADKTRGLPYHEVPRRRHSSEIPGSYRTSFGHHGANEYVAAARVW